MLYFNFLAGICYILLYLYYILYSEAHVNYMYGAFIKRLRFTSFLHDSFSFLHKIKLLIHGINNIKVRMYIS